MMPLSNCFGIKTFVMSIFHLLKNGKMETCSQIEQKITTGLASYLFKEYQEDFLNCGFCESAITDIDKYFTSTWDGCADGNEYRKYDCEEKDGLWLILHLILNDI